MDEKCCLCGRPATKVVTTDGVRLAYCWRCNRDDEFAHRALIERAREVEGPEFAEKLARLLGLS